MMKAKKNLESAFELLNRLEINGVKNAQIVSQIASLLSEAYKNIEKEKEEEENA